MSNRASDSIGRATEENALPKIDPKSVVAALAPLLDDQAILQRTYRSKRSPDLKRTVHIADADDAVAKGWLVVKKGKRSATIQKPKPISQLLEDRFWALCHSMG